MMPDTERKELLSQYELLSTEYISLLNDKGVLLNWGKPQLEALYSTKIGIYQVQRLQLQLRIKALKRKIELVYGAINRNEDFNITEIELQVATELAEAELKIMNEINGIEKAKALLTNLDTPERSAALRKLFKQLAKQLHPDVNPALTAQQQEIWYKIKDAYECGDLERLKALEVVYEKEIKQLKNELSAISEEQLTLRIATLKEGIKLLDHELSELKKQFPFTISEQLKDDEWVATQVAEIKEQHKKLEEYETELQHEYAEIINLYGN